MKRNCWYSRQKTWTDEKLNWLKESANIYDDRDVITKAFNKTFNTNITSDTLKSVSTRYKLHLPVAKRRVYLARENLKKGHIAIGSETKKIGEDIYMSSKSRTPYIKVNSSKDRNKKYVLKTRYYYELYYNEKVNKQDVIMFLNGDKNDYRKENLYKTTRITYSTMVANKLFTEDVKENISRLKWCEWKEKIGNISQK